MSDFTQNLSPLNLLACNNLDGTALKMGKRRIHVFVIFYDNIISGYGLYMIFPGIIKMCTFDSNIQV